MGPAFFSAKSSVCALATLYPIFHIPSRPIPTGIGRSLNPRAKASDAAFGRPQSDMGRFRTKEINGDAADVRMQVNASFKAGSFGIDLVATQHLLSQLKDIFSGTGAAAISNASGILAAIGMTVTSGYGLIQLLLKLRGRRPVKIEQKGEIAHVWINQTETVEVEHNVIRLYRNSGVRTSLEKVVSPLERDGIDDEDKNFLAKVDAGERFGKGDVLFVDLRQVQSIEGAKLVTESIIATVIEHRQPLQQRLL